MKRTEARVFAMQLLFEMEAQGEFTEAIKDRFTEANKISGNAKKYINAVYDACIAHLPEVDAELNRYSRKWPTSRMPKVDLAIARLAAIEIKYIDDVPAAAAINEAVELAKRYSGEQSPAFLNGLLGKLAQ